MPKANSIDEMQEILKGWFRKPGETDDEYRERINSGNYEISIPLFSVPKLIEEQEERLRFENAKPVVAEPVKTIEGTSEPEKPFFKVCDDLDEILDDTNKKKDE